MQAIKPTVEHIALSIPLDCPLEQFKVTTSCYSVQLSKVIEEVAGESIDIPDALYVRVYLPFTQFSSIRFCLEL